MKKFSICIATYEMGGYGFTFLDQLLTELKMQTLQDFEIVISDQSNDTKVLEVCQKHSELLDIKYFKYFYNRGKAACNINRAMEYASGEVIKILYQDDFFVTADALQKIYDEFQKGAKWVVNGFTHSKDKKEFFNTRIPFYGDHVLIGENTIGNPSNFSILASERLYMDESILYVVDCEFYYRTKQKLGLPVVVQDILVCARHHPVSAVDDPSFYSLKDSEVAYCLKKHNLKLG
jgi:glycosyltransferase involved in cell wall biosynthesis